MKSQKKKVLRSQKYRKIKFKPKNTRIKNVGRYKKKKTRKRRHKGGNGEGGLMVSGTQLKAPNEAHTKIIDYACWDKHIFASVMNTVEFLLTTYLLPGAQTDGLTTETIKQEYINNLNPSNKLHTDESCYQKRDEIDVFSTDSFDFNAFATHVLSKLTTLELSIKNFTFKKYLLYMDFLARKSKRTGISYLTNDPSLFSLLQSDISATGSPTNVLLEILNQSSLFQPGTDSKPFMIGFSLLQSLILFSPFYKNLRILCCYDWEMKKNDWYLRSLQQSVERGNAKAYLFLPAFLKREDIVSKGGFRVTMIEIGTLLSKNFKLKELTNLDLAKYSKIIGKLITNNKSAFNYPECMRIFEIEKGGEGVSHNQPKALDLKVEPSTKKINVCSFLVPQEESTYKLDTNRKYGCEALKWLIENDFFVHGNEKITTIEQFTKQLSDFEVELKEDDSYNPKDEDKMILDTTTDSEYDKSIINFSLK